MAKVFLSLGSNIKPRKEYLQKAINLIGEKIGDIKKQSSVYQTKSWGYDDEDYLNLVLEIETKFSPEKLLSETQKIEKLIGRNSKTKINSKNIAEYSARKIDIDILFYDNLILETPNLQIPHKLLHKRDFVLIPILEIAPNFVHPVFQKNIAELRKQI